MNYSESNAGPRIMGRLDRGEELVASVLALCAKHGIDAAELRAFGSLVQVELREPILDTGHGTRAWGPPRRLTTPCLLLHLSGRICDRDGALDLEASCVIGRTGERSGDLLGGYVIRAIADVVEFVVERHDRALAKKLPTTNLPTSATASKSASPSVRVETKAQPDSSPGPSDSDEQPIAAGDILEHPKFGRCDVERLEGDAEFAQVRLRNGRVVRLSLDVLHVIRDGVEGNRRRWRVH